MSKKFESPAKKIEEKVEEKPEAKEPEETGPLESFFFPSAGVVIMAKNREQAELKLKKLKA